MAKDTSKWTYVYSKELEQEIAIHKETHWAYCKDGVKYSPSEYRLLQQKGGIKKQVHLLKKLFDGKIVN